MGLIKNIFGAIFGVIGGVFGAIAGIFGIGKKSEFFLELDDSGKGAPAIEPAKPETAKSADKVVPAAIEKGATVKPAAAAKKPEPAKPVAAPVTAPATAAFASEYLVNPNLSSNTRRRPGPSLSPFLDLARQVKAPAK
ncbi:MAG TPA: hypothetical protein V6D07_05680 [Trichocoleus sp.]